MCDMCDLQHMGKANVTCEGKCTCDPKILDGHHERKTSVIVIEQVRIHSNGTGACTLVLTSMQVGTG